MSVHGSTGARRQVVAWERWWRRSVLVMIAASLVAAVVPPAAADAATQRQRPRPIYLALGDSWAYGIGATPPASEGYVAELAELARDELDCARRWWGRYREGCEQLKLKNLAVPGATTDTLIDEQLRDAVRLLIRRNRDFDRRNDVELVTLHIGGNDIFGPLRTACLDPDGDGGLAEGCLAAIEAELTDYARNLTRILASLRLAGGHSTTMVIGTYDNAIPYCQLKEIPGAGALAARALEGGSDFPGLHDIMRQVAARFDTKVAEVYGKLEPDDWVGGEDCLHPDDSGYEKVATQFAAVLP